RNPDGHGSVRHCERGARRESTHASQSNGRLRRTRTARAGVTIPHHPGRKDAAMSRRLLRRCVAAGAVVCLASGAAAVALHAQIAPGSRVPAATAPDDPANAAADFSPRPPVQPLTPEAQVDTFWLLAGYRIEPVLSDPLIQDPAQIVFDGNGRMYVLELRGYFQTPDGRSEERRVGKECRSRWCG